MKKYKRDRKFLESIPEAWRDVPIGTVCMVTDESGRRVTVTYLGNRVHGKVWTSGGMYPITDVSPVEAWQPEVNEWVAKWTFCAVWGAQIRFEPLRPGDTVNFNIGRIPRNEQGVMQIADEMLYCGWWMDHAEKYEADNG